MSGDAPTFEWLPLGYRQFYLLMFAVALIAAPLSAFRHGLSPGRVYLAAIIAAAAALLGGRLDYLAKHLEEATQLAPGALITANGTGSYGVYVLGLAGATAGFRWLRIEPLRGLDALAPALALALVCGRLGCLAAGCCHGSPSEVPWAIRFPGGSIAHQMQVAKGLLAADDPVSLPVHPVQLYEVAFGVLAVLVLLAVHPSWLPKGAAIWGYLSAYALLRCLLEFFRGDPGATLQRPSLALALWSVFSMFALALFVRCVRSSVRASPTSAAFHPT